ncbi:hypothetical protein ACFLZW_06465 [Chloroflexota bacterium]
MRSRLWFVYLLVLALVALPFLFAVLSAGDDHVFVGFLLNPIDGNSYLAKMYQGWSGEWRFTLPFTADPGDGGYLFLFYLFLGHLARWLGLPLIVVFHLTRLFSALFMLLMLGRFMKVFLPDAGRPLFVFVLSALGSGLGWLVFPSGFLTSDFWVAEAYPFLSAYANPHFSLGLGLMLWMLILIEKDNVSSKRQFLKLISKGALPVILSLVLAILAPFGVVIVVVVLGGLIVWDLWENRHDVWSRRWKKIFTSTKFAHLISLTIWICLGAGPVLVYDFAIARLDPALAGWNAQNLTPSPPLWDLIVSFSPVLMIALLGSMYLVKHNDYKARLFLVWAGVGVALLYSPMGLQRRFIMGLFIPFTALAGLGLAYLSEKGFGRIGLIVTLLMILSLPTNLLVLLLGQYGVQTHDPLYYLTQAEAQALEWVEANTKPDGLVLASPEIGLFIPGQTGRRVIYGHPYETVNAEAEQAALVRFFESRDIKSVENFLFERRVGYVFYGPRERALGELPETSHLEMIYEEAGIKIFMVSAQTIAP